MPHREEYTDDLLLILGERGLLNAGWNSWKDASSGFIVSANLAGFGSRSLLLAATGTARLGTKSSPSETHQPNKQTSRFSYSGSLIRELPSTLCHIIPVVVFWTELLNRTSYVFRNNQPWYRVGGGGFVSCWRVLNASLDYRFLTED